MMKTTLSIIKADIGSIGGHIRPSERQIGEGKNYVGTKGKGLTTDVLIIHTGDDSAILLPHSLGNGSDKVHQLAWDGFVVWTKVAKEQGLYRPRGRFSRQQRKGEVSGAAMLPYIEKVRLFGSVLKRDKETRNLIRIMTVGAILLCILVALCVVVPEIPPSNILQLISIVAGAMLGGMSRFIWERGGCILNRLHVGSGKGRRR